MKDHELALYRAGLAWALQYVGKVAGGPVPLFLNGVPAETDLRVIAALPTLWPVPNPVQEPMDFDALFKLCEAVAPIKRRELP